MSDAPAARWLARAWLVLVASSALYFLADNEADNDLWVHLFSGRVILAGGWPPPADTFSYTAAGAPWINHEWLTQSAFALLYAAAGSPGLWLFKLAVALLTAWLVWVPIARRSDSPWVGGGVMVLALAVLSRGYAVRPQMLTYLGVAALLAWLDRERPARWTTVAAVAAGFALWANTHGAIIVGLGILALHAVLHRRDAAGSGTGSRFSSRAALVVVAALAACLTPYGPRLFLYIASELTVPHPLTEWQPVHLLDPAHAPFLLMVGLLVATLPFAATLRRRPWWAVLVAGVGVMAFRHQRHTPLFALCAAAPLAEQLDGALTWLAARTRFRLSAPATALVAAALVVFAVVQLGGLLVRQARSEAGYGRIVFDARDYPVGALRFIRSSGLTGNLALPLDWGGYALWHAAPGIKVSLDGRFATIYPPAVVEDNFACFRADGDPAAAHLLERYDTTLLLAPRGIPTAADQRWTLLYSDSVAALYGRAGHPATVPGDAPRGWLPFP